MYRNTYVSVHLKNIENNIKRILEHYPDYQYYFGVVKADGYGHGVKLVEALLNGGINYLAVATLEEALEIRKIVKDTPILCLGYIHPSYLSICEKESITITIPSLDYVKEMNNSKVKCHIKLDTGMHRLGISKKEEYEQVYTLLKEQVEGVYTHIYKASSKEETEKQLDLFEDMIEHTKEIPIIHVCASEALLNHQRRVFENGCRLGIIMYGLIDAPFPLQSTFQLKSEIIQIHSLKKGDTLGYDACYRACKDLKIGVVPIGYADGILRKNEGRNVYIQNRPYPIVGRICMDMLFVEIDDTISNHDTVDIIKDKEHIKEIANHLGTIPYEVICNIGKRVPRVWK